jgi:hypothetical protein
MATQPPFFKNIMNDHFQLYRRLTSTDFDQEMVSLEIQGCQKLNERHFNNAEG